MLFYRAYKISITVAYNTFSSYNLFVMLVFQLIKHYVLHQNNGQSKLLWWCYLYRNIFTWHTQFIYRPGLLNNSIWSVYVCVCGDTFATINGYETEWTAWNLYYMIHWTEWNKNSDVLFQTYHMYMTYCWG